LIKCYPNPFAQSVRIESGNGQPLVICIYNSSGQLVFKSAMNGSYLWNGTSKGGSALPEGLYMIKLYDQKDGSLVSSEKVIRRKS